MCTSLLHPAGPGGLLLLGNRDELHTRSRAILPEVHALPHTRAIYPIDRDAGGTWIGVNAHGLAVSLLNFYDAAPMTPAIDPYHSRGHIPTALLGARSLSEALELMREAVYPHLPHTRPFVALVAHAPPDGPARAVRVVWSGDTITQAAMTLPHVEVSSGVLIAEVRPAREATVRDGIEGLDPVHDPIARWMAPFAQHDPERGRHSVSMRDDFSRTMSHTAIEVRPDHVRMTYLDGPPSDGPQAHVVALPRA